MPLRVHFTRAFTTAAMLAIFAAGSPAIATEGKWFQDGWYPQGQYPSQGPANGQPLGNPTVADQDNASALDQPQSSAVRFIQPGREEWLADCRQSIAQTQKNAAGKDSRPTSAPSTVGPDVCQAHLDAHNERYIESIRDWVSSSGETRSQMYMPIEYNFEEAPVQQQASRPEVGPAQASLDTQISRR